MNVSKRIASRFDVVGEAVVGDDRRDRGEQADRGGDQRFGDAGRDVASVAWARWRGRGTHS